MTIRLAVPNKSSTLPDAEVMVIPDVSLMVTPCGSHYLYYMSKTIALVPNHKNPKVKFFIPITVAIAMAMCG